jgi:hypothetical protein
MDAPRSRSSSITHPTMMDLQRGQLDALRSGDERSAAAYRLAVFLKLEEAQAAAVTVAE